MFSRREGNRTQRIREGFDINFLSVYLNRPALVVWDRGQEHPVFIGFYRSADGSVRIFRDGHHIFAEFGICFVPCIIVKAVNS